MSIINIQPIEKFQEGSGLELAVHAIFYTIQGEGPFCGHPAVFIRLAGCNLQCPACDTDYTSTREALDIDTITERVIAMGTNVARPLIVITGGEPFRQNIKPLIHDLIDGGFKVQIETNGTLAPPAFLFSYENLTIVCSPKTGKINKVLEPYVNAYKYVLSYDSVDPEDGLPILALDHSAKPRVARPPKGYTGKIYLQPMDAKDSQVNELNIQAVKESCMKFGYIFQLQVHKLIGVE